MYIYLLLEVQPLTIRMLRSGGSDANLLRDAWTLTAFLGQGAKALDSLRFHRALRLLIWGLLVDSEARKGEY
jgi:hypothetical protein